VGFTTFADNLGGHAFLYSGGAFVDLGTLPGGGQSGAAAINDAGQVVGYSFLDGAPSHHAFLYNGGPLVDLGTFGGNESAPTGINKSGQVTGYATLANGAK